MNANIFFTKDKMKTVFEKQTRLKDDVCEVESQTTQNKDVFSYSTFNIYQTNKDTEKECNKNIDKIKEFSIENRMQIRDGYGFTNACRVDMDSKVRNNFEMTDKGKQQLFTRTFQGGPNVNKGGFEPEIDAKLTQGAFSTRKDACDVLSERSFDRFEPMSEAMLQNIQNVDNIVPTWTWGGVSTREVNAHKKC